MQSLQLTYSWLQGKVSPHGRKIVRGIILMRDLLRVVTLNLVGNVLYCHVLISPEYVHVCMYISRGFITDSIIFTIKCGPMELAIIFYEHFNYIGWPYIKLKNRFRVTTRRKSLIIIIPRSTLRPCGDFDL